MDKNVVTARPSGEFDVEILSDLISQGYEGQELLQEFIDMRNKIRPAFELMMADIDAMARTLPHVTLEDIFGKDDENE